MFSYNNTPIYRYPESLHAETNYFTNMSTIKYGEFDIGWIPVEGIGLLGLNCGASVHGYVLPQGNNLWINAILTPTLPRVLYSIVATGTATLLVDGYTVSIKPFVKSGNNLANEHTIFIGETTFDYRPLNPRRRITIHVDIKWGIKDSAGNVPSMLDADTEVVITPGT